MKHSSKLILGLVLVAVGVLWILNATGVFNFMFSTRGWWTLFIIVPCAIGLFENKDKVGPCIGICCGILLLLAVRDVITWHMCWQIGLALMLIGLGLQLMLFRTCRHDCMAHEFKTVSRDGKNIRHIESAFGKQDISFAGEIFEGADVESSFGGVTLDLHGAVITEDAVIELKVGFAGVTIIIPENLPVQIAASCSFGGITDNRRVRLGSGSPSLIITGSVGFGGVELRN